ncbi:RecF/RecN/SMC N-terminal domain-containing protein [Entamoeba marina]
MGGEDINETIKALERGINQLEIEISSKEDLNKSTDAERNVLRKQIGDLKTVYGNTQRDVRKLETKKMEIESIKIKERDDLAELEKNLNDATNELDLQISNLKNIKRRQDDAQKDLDSKQREYQNVCGEATTANAERERHENELSECKTQLDKLNEEKDEVEKTRDKLLVERQQIFQKLTTVEIELKHAEEELSGVGNYSDSPRPQDVIAKNLKESEAKKKRHEEDVTDLTVVDINLLNREFEKKRDQLERLKTQLNSIDELSEQLARELSQRQKRYKSLLNKTSTKTLDLFNQYLREIGATGKLKLEHKRHLLDVEVALTSLEKDSRDSKTLSGGERSFSTVCLLLALWNVVDCPFRAMDEFDVYMDSAVRKKAIETLMKVTKNLKNRQYIFVTPHNIDSVTQDDNVKVFLLKRPERGQTPT